VPSQVEAFAVLHERVYVCLPAVVVMQFRNFLERFKQDALLLLNSSLVYMFRC
jgi:hypothetical protein